MTKDELIQASKYIAIVKDLDEIWFAHDGQVDAGYLLFHKFVRKLFIECGRKWGKTEFVIYVLYRWAMTIPGGSFYYIAPWKNQARRLIWDTGRIQNFLKDKRGKYIKKVLDQAMMVRFYNGSFIQLDGADNYEAHRGTNPHGMVYEEAKDHRKEFHVAMEPNLLTHMAQLLIIGTPPEADNPENTFIKLSKECKEEDDSGWLNMPSWMNPHVSKEELLNIKRKLIKRGEYDVWLREYAAKRCRGGANAIFSMLSSVHVQPYDQVMETLRQEWKRLEFYCTADPASASTFGVLFTAVNPYTRKVYHLDELYEKHQGKMSVKPMWAAICEIINEINPDMTKWNFTYDEAAKWWANEMMNEFNIHWSPTQKAQNKKADGLSLVKDQLLDHLFIMTDKCINLEWEMINYYKDKKGKIPKENDHLIDDLRYVNAAAHLDTVDEDAPPPPVEEMEKRGFTPQQDIEESESLNDWTEDLVGDL